MTNRTKCSRNPLEDEAIRKTAERALKELRRREEEQIMEGNAMKEQILMKLAEAQKKRGFKQKLKDNAWTVGLGVGTSAPSVGFAIDQQRRNIKKEKATGEKPKSLIERRPGVVSGAITGGVVSPLLRTAMRGSRGGNTSLAQLASEMVTGAAGGALSGALIIDPLTRWGTRKYYQHRDKEIERAIRNRTQGSPLQKEAAYEPQHTREMEEYTMNERVLMKLAEAEKKRGFKQKLKDNAWTIGLAPGSLGFAIDQQRRNIKKEKATGEKPKSLIERRPGVVAGALSGGLVSASSLGLARSKVPTWVYPLAAASGALGGAAAGALISDPLARWGTKRYYRKKDERALRNQQRNELLAKRFAEDEILRQAQVRRAEKYLQENPLQKTASYYAARELLGLQKEASLTLAGSQSIKKTPAKDQILKMIRDLAKKK